MRDVFAGVDIGGTRIKAGLVDRTGQLIELEVFKTAECPDAESLLDKITRLLVALTRSAGVRLIAVGVGCPGRIDFAAGRVVWLKSKLEFLENLPLASWLSERLGCPVVCDNDANAILVGEMQYGAGRGARDVIGITVGTGIGGAFAVGGNLVRGHNWAAGHFGYMSYDPRGPRHACGNNGIFEEQASQSGIQRQIRCAAEAGEISTLTARIAAGEDPGIRELFQSVEARDQLGQRLAQGMITGIGVMTANLIFALDPELVLVGGGILKSCSGIVELLRHEVASRLDYMPFDAMQILPMALGDTAGVLGSASLAMQSIQQ